MKIIIFRSISLIIVFWATQTFAFFDAELYYGSSSEKAKYTVSSTEKTKTVKGTEMGAGFFIDPIPAVPIAFGVIVSQVKSNHDAISQDIADDSASTIQTSVGSTGYTSKGTGSSTALFYGPVVKAWIPMPKIKPYIKLGYLTGNELEDYSLSIASPSTDTVAVAASIGTKTTYTHTATEAAVGIEFQPIKLTGIFVEYVMQSGSRKASKLTGDSTVTIDGTSTPTTYSTSDLSDSDKKSKTTSATSIRIGVSAGI